jgi:heme O synthase-like polyprenyltransferase
MLPTQKKDKGTALQIILYTVWLILASLLPVFCHWAFIYYASSGSCCFVGIVDAFLRSKIV